MAAGASWGKRYPAGKHFLNRSEPLLGVVASLPPLLEGALLLEGWLARSLFSRSASSQLRFLPAPPAFLAPTRSQNRQAPCLKPNLSGHCLPLLAQSNMQA